ncbi:hypothetical protein [Anaerovorax odorimutans]|uniref:hypothetical protein n=1 Tax=Anaerovorax odorimutans TaxID=109327 RepID=UPI0004199B5C|nr:hypothetical protein [Anaerovorax odorimutans]
MKCEMRERVLEYLKGGSNDSEIEKHLEHCEQCQALMEGYLTKEAEIKLPEAKCINGNLKEQVEHYDKGTKRIIVFTIVGLIMGWFSYKYYTTDLLPLKIIIGIPYKINEMIHQTLHHHNSIYMANANVASITKVLDEFFPQAYFVSFIAEFGIASLIGGAIYGSIGFFTGDKRIFTLTRYLKFTAVWVCIISLAFAGTFIANKIAVDKNQTFEDLSGFYINYESGGTGVYKDDTGEGGKFFDSLKKAFYKDGKIAKEENVKRDMDDEEVIEFIFGSYGQRYMASFINLKEKYLVTDVGNIYKMSDEFCQLVLKYQEEQEEEENE